MTRTATAAAILLLGACNVQKSDNGATTVSLDTNKAEQGVKAAGNEAQKIGGHIVNDVKETGDIIENKAGNVDVNLGGDGSNAQANAAANQN